MAGRSVSAFAESVTVAALEDDPYLVRPIAAELLDGLAGRDRAELMADYLEPLSVLSLGSVLGGEPVKNALHPGSITGASGCLAAPVSMGHGFGDAKVMR